MHDQGSHLGTPHKFDKPVGIVIVAALALFAFVIASKSPATAQPVKGLDLTTSFQSGQFKLDGNDNEGTQSDYIDFSAYWVGDQDAEFMLASFSTVSSTFQPVYDEENLYLLFNGERQEKVDWLSVPASSEDPATPDSALATFRVNNPNLVIRLTGVSPDQCFGVFARLKGEEKFPIQPFAFWKAADDERQCDRRLLPRGI